ncbi:PREDICTED: phospholipid scramblase 1-like [Branchiostoma belcheri]|uniref:Phospholipid scramblase n=1 Tax=Branchiostoma belcheri TaxID=7741 RepID=A0A6P4ZNQ3_BRABE|nr:PREDICTED: phospholipid scramblase 1-like [Branchiostoma belcheri]
MAAKQQSELLGDLSQLVSFQICVQIRDGVCCLRGQHGRSATTISAGIGTDAAASHAAARDAAARAPGGGEDGRADVGGTPQQAIPGCPPGLEYLTQIDQIIVHQQIELFEAFTNVQMANKYAIKNSMGQQIFFAYEDSEFCMRICCGPNRSFTFHILDNAGHEVMRMRREFKCCAGCPWCASCARDCCAFEVYVESPPGQLIGMAIQS